MRHRKEELSGGRRDPVQQGQEPRSRGIARWSRGNRGRELGGLRVNQRVFEGSANAGNWSRRPREF